jgi:hypothetical protein
MSVYIISVAFRFAQVKSASLVVLLALGDFANRCAIAYPSLNTLKAKARVSLPSLYRHLAILLQKREITIFYDAYGRSVFRVLPGLYTSSGRYRDSVLSDLRKDFLQLRNCFLISEKIPGLQTLESPCETCPFHSLTVSNNHREIIIKQKRGRPRKKAVVDKLSYRELLQAGLTPGSAMFNDLYDPLLDHEANRNGGSGNGRVNQPADLRGSSSSGRRSP